ncbi:hypothetical protein SEPCBS119000_003198 [Sporothrix epigloea]|uniref:Uncharacterized protein n=1 Tax=Sporothrix epigloea TaxID=1892477 RepID=A0ABP0DN38_9PEZI
MSTGAKAGIGIGAAVGAVALIAAIVALQISDPMPGAGRVYASDDQGHFEPPSELEMKSRRYEEMVPRHVPRNMV